MLGLPLEIQSEIFIHAHRDNSNDEALLLPVEVTLSHVCPQWRNIAMNLPILWTAFKFDNRRRASAPVDKLEEYLVRSRTHLLELYFEIFVSGYEEADECFKLVEIAIAHARRWRRFTLFIEPIYAPIGVMDDLQQLNTPNLEYFAMCLADDEHPENPEGISPSVLIQGAPKLSVIRIDTTSHLHSLPPLSNITTLTIQDSPETQEYPYSFHAFRSILMIPTLTNLSIESSTSLDTSSMGNPETLPRIVMPSLKTLRITQDDDILSIISLLDAPLLETLVLHGLDLTWVYIGQDIHKITPFKRLNTFALLNCSYNRGANFDIIDAILNKLACCATHVVLSTLNIRSLIERGSNMLNFDQHKWPRLQRITLDLSISDRSMHHVKNFEHSPHSLTVQVVEPVLEHWRGVQLDSLTRLEKVCELKIIKAGDLMMDEYWPVPGGIFQEDGNLGIRWEEIIRARGPLEQ
jgi:hypothetical protein